MDNRSAAEQLIERLRAQGVPIELSDEPLNATVNVTPAQKATIDSGGLAALADSTPSRKTVEQTEEEMLLEKRELLAQFEQGDVPVIEPGYHPDDPQWKDYRRRKQEWRRSMVGPKPEPPKRPSIREHPDFQRYLVRQAKAYRNEVRMLETKIALDRHHARRRRTPGLRGRQRVPHGGRRRRLSSRRRVTGSVRQRASRAGPDPDADPAGVDDRTARRDTPDTGFELGYVDRWPLLWRARMARCRWHEWREGWSE